jgi:glycosyltransferase involved in cell wall biosynthesis
MIANVSVVVPCYNAEKTIGRAIGSVAAQTLQPLELICVDDGSTDTTRIRLSELQSRLPELNIRIIANDENCGPARARNIGWENACGAYIAFLDADDTWREDKLRHQIGFMEDARDCIITGHRVMRAGECSTGVTEARYTFQAVSFRSILLANRMLTPSVVIRNTIDLRFDESMPRCEDYMLWCTIMAAGNKAFWSKESLASVHKGYYGDSGLSGSIFAMARWEFVMYWKLFQRGCISAALLAVLVPWLSIKIARRCVLLCLQKVI